MKKLRGTYASVSTAAFYFADRTHKATSRKTVTSQYRCGALKKMKRYCKGVSGEITATDDKDLQVNFMLSIIQYNGPFLPTLGPFSNAVHPSPCTLQVSTVHGTYYAHSHVLG
jgi:hypothetical protein